MMRASRSLRSRTGSVRTSKCDRAKYCPRACLVAPRYQPNPSALLRFRAVAVMESGASLEPLNCHTAFGHSNELPGPFTKVRSAVLTADLMSTDGRLVPIRRRSTLLPNRPQPVATCLSLTGNKVGLRELVITKRKEP